MAHILIVDDVPDNRETIQTFLERHGYTTSCAPNGAAALVQLGTHIPDAVVLDYRMPEMDGITLLEVMRSYLRWSHIPVILISAYANEQDISRAKTLGAYRTFAKPLADLGELMDSLEGAMRASPKNEGFKPELH